MVEHEHVWVEAIVVAGPNLIGHQITVCHICGKQPPVVVDENTSERLERDDPTV